MTSASTSGPGMGRRRRTAERVEFDALADSVFTTILCLHADERLAQFDDKDDVYSLFVGYRIERATGHRRRLHGAGTVVLPREHERRFPARFRRPSMSVVDSETTGFTLAALGILPLGYNWEVYGRVGILFATNELTSVHQRPEARSSPTSGRRRQRCFFEKQRRNLRRPGVSSSILRYLRFSPRVPAGASTPDLKGPGALEISTS